MRNIAHIFIHIILFLLAIKACGTEVTNEFKNILNTGEKSYRIDYTEQFFPRTSENEKRVTSPIPNEKLIFTHRYIVAKGDDGIYIKWFRSDNDDYTISISGETQSEIWSYSPKRLLEEARGNGNISPLYAKGFLQIVDNKLLQNVPDQAKMIRETVSSAISNWGIILALKFGILVDDNSVKWDGDHFTGIYTLMPRRTTYSIEGEVAFSSKTKGRPVGAKYTISGKNINQSVEIKYLYRNEDSALPLEFTLKREGTLADAIGRDFSYKIHSAEYSPPANMAVNLLTNIKYDNDNIIINYTPDGQEHSQRAVKKNVMDQGKKKTVYYIMVVALIIPSFLFFSLAKREKI